MLQGIEKWRNHLRQEQLEEVPLSRWNLVSPESRQDLNGRQERKGTLGPEKAK